MRVAVKHNPLGFHKKARDAARFAILAQERGKFWEVHDALFENVKDLGLDRYLEIAKEQGIPEADVRRVIEEKAYEDRINAEMKEMAGAGARGTPASFVNGHYVRGAQPYEKFKEAVDKALARGNLGKDSYISDIPPPKPPPAPFVGEIDVGDAPVLGPADAPVTIVLYSDFQ